MARIRTIKPEFWSDEKLGPMPLIDRLVFLGLISLADDAGRLLDSEKVVDAFVFPYTDDKSGPSLESLAKRERIVRGVTASGQRVIQIANWSRHQKVDKPNLRAALPELVAPHTVCQLPEPVANESRESRAPTNDLRPTTNDQLPTKTASATQEQELREGLAPFPFAIAIVDLLLEKVVNPVKRFATISDIRKHGPGGMLEQSGTTWADVAEGLRACGALGDGSMNPNLLSGCIASAKRTRLDGPPPSRRDPSIPAGPTRKLTRATIPGEVKQ